MSNQFRAEDLREQVTTLVQRYVEAHAPPEAECLPEDYAGPMGEEKQRHAQNRHQRRLVEQQGQAVIAQAEALLYRLTDMSSAVAARKGA